MKMWWFVLVVVLGVGCSQNKSLVAKATAYQTYFQTSYENRCQKIAGPKTCGPCQIILNDGLWKVQTANKTYQLGFVPPREKKELEDLIVALESCP